MTTMPVLPLKKKVKNVRAQLYSTRNLPALDEDNLKTLQKSLEKHNKIDDPETSEPDLEEEEDRLCVENRLWSYFCEKAKGYEDKVEQEKVNGWLKLLKTILKETQKKIEANKKHIEQLQCMIKSKYKQTHSCFKEIESLKIEKTKQKKSRRKRDVIDSAQEEKVNVIHENIKSLNQEIAQQNSHKKMIQVEKYKLEEERKSLLVNLLKHGYYLHNGTSWILEKMTEINYRPKIQDFPTFLDERSKIYLLKLYQQIQNQKQICQTSQRQKPPQRTKSTSEITRLAKQEHFKDIYNGTKDYLVQWVKKEGWKNDLKLPKIKPEEKNFSDDWSNIERKRIAVAYPEDMRALVRKIEFGIKLETIFP